MSSLEIRHATQHLQLTTVQPTNAIVIIIMEPYRSLMQHLDAKRLVMRHRHHYMMCLIFVAVKPVIYFYKMTQF